MSEQEQDKTSQEQDITQAQPETAGQPTLEEENAQLKARLGEVEKALSEAELRAQAEIQNMRRRLERDLENAHKFALEKFAKDILSVADSLERALASLDREDAALQPAVEGTELTLKVLLDVFARFNIEQIDPQGEPFNPEQHEAMAMVPNPAMESNTVMDVLEKGYLLNGRLVRPARVVVVKNEG